MIFGFERDLGFRVWGSGGFFRGSSFIHAVDRMPNGPSMLLSLVSASAVLRFRVEGGRRMCVITEAKKLGMFADIMDKAPCISSASRATWAPYARS